MNINVGGGRLATIHLDSSTRLNVNGLSYETHCSLEFWDHDSGESVCVFASRNQLMSFGKKIVEEIENAPAAGA